MTDAEIMKALRLCRDPDTCSDDCCFYVEGETIDECTSKLSVAALDLIKRQQAEITLKTEYIQEQRDVIAELKDKIESFADRIVERLEEAKRDSNTDVYAYGAYKKAITIVKGCDSDDR